MLIHPEGVSLVICTYNGSALMPETIRHILLQDVKMGIPWEVLFIDNASTDNTAKVVKEAWTSSIPMRVIDEPQKGLMHARYKGIREARYEYISFIDDDNWISPFWIQNIYNIFRDHPDVGMCGGRNYGTFEKTPPDWFENIEGSYAIGPQGKQSGDISKTRGHLWGAGLSFRKSAFEKIIQSGFESLLTGRIGKNLTAGEDTEMAFSFRLAGWKLWYSEDLSLQHFITARRFEWDYVKRMYKGFGISHAVFELYKRALNKKGLNLFRYYYKIIRDYTPFFIWKIKHFRGNHVGDKKELLYEFHRSKLQHAVASFFKLKKYDGRIREFQLKINP